MIRNPADSQHVKASYIHICNPTDSSIIQPSVAPAARIFVFDAQKWPFQGVRTLVEIQPRFERLLLGAYDNPRALPQQSVNMVSNIVDIESYVENWEKTGGKVLRRVDIPLSERTAATRELRIMGITSASLFPGLDGVCRTLEGE